MYARDTAAPAARLQERGGGHRTLNVSPCTGPFAPRGIVSRRRV